MADLNFRSVSSKKKWLHQLKEVGQWLEVQPERFALETKLKRRGGACAQSPGQLYYWGPNQIRGSVNQQTVYPVQLSWGSSWLLSGTPSLLVIQALQRPIWCSWSKNKMDKKQKNKEKIRKSSMFTWTWNVWKQFENKNSPSHRPVESMDAERQN